MKLLGIDYGRRRIGIAVTDKTGTIIKGRPTVDRKKSFDILSTLCNIALEESPGALIFGIPLGPDDEETVMSKEIRIFAESLNNKLHNKIPIHFIDESFSSIKAQKQLRFRKKKERQNKNNINRLAACNILETFIMEQ